MTQHVFVKSRKALFDALFQSFPETSRVDIAAQDTFWFCQLAPAVIAWTISGAIVRVAASKSVEQDRSRGESERRRTLRGLGASVEEMINPALPSASEIPSLQISTVDNVEHGRMAIALYPKVADDSPPIDLRRIEPAYGVLDPDLESRLRMVAQYGRAEVEIGASVLNPSALFLSRPIRNDYRLRQLEFLLAVVPRPLDLVAGAMLSLSDGSSLYLNPPIVEVSPDRNVVLEGNTRAYWLWSHGIQTVEVVSVRGVRDPLPWEPTKIDKAFGHRQEQIDWASPLIRRVREAISSC